MPRYWCPTTNCCVQTPRICRPKPGRTSKSCFRTERTGGRHHAGRIACTQFLEDTAAHWKTSCRVRDSAAYKDNKDPAVAAALRVPDAEIYAIDVSFPMLKDKAELDYLNQQPTSFVLPPEAVDRLRAAAGTIIMDSPEFKRLL